MSSIVEVGIDQPTPEITITGNKFTDDIECSDDVRNGIAIKANLVDNTFKGQVVALTDDGSSR